MIYLEIKLQNNTNTFKVGYANEVKIFAIRIRPRQTIWLILWCM